MWLTWTLFLIGAYLIGSIPFGLLIGLAHGVDIRSRGSGNIGATNLGRALGKGWAIGCFFLDMAKGAVPMVVYGAAAGVLGNLDTFRGLPPKREAEPIELLLWILVGLAAILGHIFPLYLRFKGGKGVATAFGVLIGMWPHLTAPAFAAFFVWFLVLRASRYVGLASCVAAVSLPVWYVLWAMPKAPESSGHVLRELGRGWPIIVVTSLLATLVIYKHRGNLARIMARTEPRVGEK
jgi:glycerol-3-phosphate acyltransferase PlsY